MQIKLDARLQAAACLVLAGKPAADIGTDHNYLPVYLAIHNICPFVIATDKAKTPCRNAAQLVELLSLSSRITVRRGDGLSVLKPGEVDTIVMAGMGGRLIMDMLSREPAVLAQTTRLVLQPQKNTDLLRRWLAENGWKIVQESLAYESGFYYVIVAAEHGQMQLSADEEEYGPCLLGAHHPLLLEYLQLKRADMLSLSAELEQKEGVEAARRLQQLQAKTARLAHLIDKIF